MIDHTLRPSYPTFIYLPVAAYAMFPFVLLGVLTLPLFGITASVDAITEFGILHFGQLLPWIRLASVFYSVLGIVVLYLIARRLFERRETALFAPFSLRRVFCSYSWLTLGKCGVFSFWR
jgi:hypothetical protein